MSFEWLNDTGQIDEAFTKGEGIQSVLIEWGNEVIGKLKTSLNASTSTGTSKALEQSLVVLPIELGDDRFTLKFQSEDYWKFINSGVRGVGGQKKDGGVWNQKGGSSPYSFHDKKPPKDALSLWAYVKGVNVWAVQKSIFHRGIRPTHFWDNVINQQLVNDLVKRLEKAGAKEIEIVLSKDFKDGQ